MLSFNTVLLLKCIFSEELKPGFELIFIYLIFSFYNKVKFDMSSADRLNATLKFHCAEHPTRNIEGVDLKASDTKCIYCLVCILQNPSAHELYQNLQTFPAFLDSTAIAFASEKAQVMQISNVPKEYLMLVAKKSEYIRNVKTELDRHRQQIENATEDIKNVMIERIERKKSEFLRLLDNHFENYCQKYEELEKTLRMCYPRQEDIDALFPTRDELENDFRRTRSTTDVEAFVKKIKNQLEENKNNIGASFLNDEIKQQKLETLKAELLDLEIFKRDVQGEIQAIRNEAKEALEHEIQPSSSLASQNSEPFPSGELNLSPEDFQTIKGWLPDQYSENFEPQLIYKGLRDGITPEAFHTHCDEKGPTITIIKGMFTGSLEMTVFGGFLDKDWHKKNTWIPSNDAFVFSLTSNIKCPIAAASRAAYGGANRGPAFGYGHDIMVAETLNKSYVNPQSYTETAKIVKSSTYGGSNTINFTPYDIEVYSFAHSVENK